MSPGQDDGFELGGGLLIFGRGDQLGVPPRRCGVGSSGDVSRADAWPALPLPARSDVLLRLPGTTRRAAPGVDHGLNAASGERFASVGEHPQRLELAVDFRTRRFSCAPRRPQSRARQGVGLTVVAGVDSRTRAASFAGTSRTCSPSSRSRWASGRPSRWRPRRPRPGPARSSRTPHRGVAGWSVVNRPDPSSSSRWSTTSIVADSLWGSTPMMTCSMCCSRLCSSDRDGEVGIATTSRAVP